MNNWVSICHSPKLLLPDIHSKCLDFIYCPYLKFFHQSDEKTNKSICLLDSELNLLFIEKIPLFWNTSLPKMTKSELSLMIEKKLQLCRSFICLLDCELTLSWISSHFLFHWMIELSISKPKIGAPIIFSWKFLYSEFI